MKSDIAATNNAEKFLKDYCGIDLSNTDTGAITGADAGGSRIKTASSIVTESGSLDTSFKENQFSLPNYGITFYLSELDSNERVTGTLSFNDLTPQQQYIWRGLKTWWASNALALVTESYGSNFKFSSGTSYPKTIYFGFYNRADFSLAESGPLGAEGDASNFVFRVNMNKFDSINTSDANGIANNGDYLDSTPAHEFTHCVMAANIKYYTSLPQFIKEGIAELTIGGDGDTYLKALANKSAVTATGTNKSWFDTALDLTNVSTGDAKAYAGGYMFSRYLAKQAADGGITEGADSIKNTVRSATINALGGNDTISNTAQNVNISGGKGNDSLWGDAGADTFFYSNGDGKDVIFGFANNDMLKITGAFSASYKKSNDAIYFKVGSTKNAVTLKNFTALITKSAAQNSSESRFGAKIFTGACQKRQAPLLFLNAAARFWKGEFLWKRSEASSTRRFLLRK